MGNLLSNGGNEWRFRWLPVPEENMQPLSIESASSSKGPQRIFIGGSLPIECTLQTCGALIWIEDSHHSVSILGSGNTVHIESGDVILRLEGQNNTLAGHGRGVTLFSDENYEAPSTLHLIRRSLHDPEGSVVGEAPELLEGLQGLAKIQPLASYANGRGENEPNYIRCTWKPVERERGSGGGGGDGGRSNLNGSDEDDDDFDGGDDDDDDDDYM